MEKKLFLLKALMKKNSCFKRPLGPAIFGAMLLIFPALSEAKTFYLDAQLAQNCSGNYSTTNRSCSGADGTAYNNLNDAVNALAGGDTLYVRNGTYYRTTNDQFKGALEVNSSGTLQQHTVVRNYPGEQPVIGTDSTKLQYNPDPSDSTGANSYFYYPNPAISIGGSYIDVIGFKTYGQVLIQSAHDITLQNSDIGGGGPRLGQGMAIIIHTAYNVTVRNNIIHHSCRGDATVGAGLSGYGFQAIIEYNEFYDTYGEDVSIKDTNGQQGRTTEVRYNFFRPSTIKSGAAGFVGILQYPDIDNIYVHHNIFYNKYIAISWRSPATNETVAYNNTFINNTYDIHTWWTGGIINSYNNLHYHSLSSDWNLYLESSQYPSNELFTNYNLFFSTSGSAKWLQGGNTKSSLSTWQSYSSKDGGSVTKDPQFIDSSGSRPENFKRTSYADAISGSSYGTVAGAYVTGNEVIGVTNLVSSDTVPPATAQSLIAQ